jgi:hypothetical protein
MLVLQLLLKMTLAHLMCTPNRIQIHLNKKRAGTSLYRLAFAERYSSDINWKTERSVEHYNLQALLPLFAWSKVFQTQKGKHLQ